LRPATSAFLSFLCAGAAVAVRPANAIVAIALLGVWLLRGLLFGKVSLGRLLAGALGLVLPLVPQIALNWKVFGRVTPLIVHSLYRMQTQWGMGALKYGTVVIPGRSPFLVYANPFFRGDPTPAAFFRNHPLDYLATLALHVFAMLDFDYPFTFITSLHVPYRWPLAAVNFGLIALALAGCVLAVARLLRRRPIDEEAFASWSTILVGGAYLAIYAPVEVENRFGLTPEALMTPLVVAVLVWLSRDARRSSVARARAVLVAAVTACVAAAFLLSGWISTKQTNAIQPSPANAFVLNPERPRPPAARPTPVP
jgi:hypothetical protein